MGRPRKRRRDDEDALSVTPADQDDISSGSQSMLGSIPSDLMPDSFNYLDPPIPLDGPGYTFTTDRHFHDSQNLLVDPYLQDAMTSGVSMPAQSLSSDLSSEQQIQFSPLPSMDGQTPACACLSGMYLTISGLQAINDFGFPHVLVKIRSSCSTVYSVLNCEQCPKERGSAMSNLMLLTTLLTSIVERYERVLKEVSVATQRATETAQMIPFRMGENRPELAHLHTGTLSCPMGFDVNLSPSEWEKLARKVIKADVIGPAPHGRQSVADLVDMFEARQHRWHLRPDVEHLRSHYENSTGVSYGEFSCLKFIDMIRKHMICLDLDKDGQI